MKACTPLVDSITVVVVCVCANTGALVVVVVVRVCACANTGALPLVVVVVV